MTLAFGGTYGGKRRNPQTVWLPAEDRVIKDFVKERTGNELTPGDELAPLGPAERLWTDLAKLWPLVGKANGFRTGRTKCTIYNRHYRLRKMAGRVDVPEPRRKLWSAEEEKALLAFVKEHKGDEMASCSEIVFQVLEERGFSNARTAAAMCAKHLEMRHERGYGPKPATTGVWARTNYNTPSTPAPAIPPGSYWSHLPETSLSASGRPKRTAVSAVTTYHTPLRRAKRPKPSPSRSANAKKPRSSPPLEPSFSRTASIEYPARLLLLIRSS